MLNVRLEREELLDNRTRLNVIFEHRSDYEKLMEDFFTIRPEIKQDLESHCREFLGRDEDLSGLFTVFSEFSRVARAEANHAIPEAEIDALKQRLNLAELWEISRFGGATDFMLYTDKQVKQFKVNGMHERLSRAYFDSLKLYDEFDYFTRDTFTVHLDSKETFDQNYDGNWYYYYK